MKLKINCEEATINPAGYNVICVDIIDADPNQVFENFTVAEIIQYLNVKDILDEIGQDEVLKHFGIELTEDDDK